VQVHKHKAMHDKSININLFEEEYKCAQVRKHKATHEIKIKIKSEGECKCAHNYQWFIYLYSEGECKCAQVRKHKAAHDKNNIPHKIKNMYQKKNASAQVCKHKAAHDNNRNDIAHTTFHYKYTNKESWGVLHYARGVRPLTKNTSNLFPAFSRSYFQDLTTPPHYP